MTAAAPELVPANDLVGLLLSRAPAVERLPVEVLTPAEVALELDRVQRRKAMEAAYEAELVRALAAARPDTDGPPPGHPGARRRGGGSPVPGTSEFFPDELAAVMRSSRPYATGVASDAYQLVERMPAVHAACAAGRLTWHRGRVFADVLGTASDEVVAVVVPALLPRAADLSAGALRKRLIAAAVAADEAFAEQRRIEAEHRAAVRTYPTADGMAMLATELPSPVTAAMWAVIDRAAQLARTAGDDRPIDLLRAEAHAAMVLRPGDPNRPAFTAHLEITAPLSALHSPGGRPFPSAPASDGAEAAEATAAAVARAAAGGCAPTAGGMPITALHLRELLARLGAVGVQAPRGGSLAVAITGDDGRLLSTVTAAELHRLVDRGCATHGRTADCNCPVVAAPREVPGHARSAAQERSVRRRDRTCRHPGCSQPAGRTDLDHVVAYDCGGRTTCENLCCLCRTHHRLKTFARGWRFVMHPDGTLTVTTPSEITRTTRPPGLTQRALPPPPLIPVDSTPPPF